MVTSNCMSTCVDDTIYDTTTEEPTTTEIETTTTVKQLTTTVKQSPTTVQPSPCLDNVEGVNRTDATLDEKCGAYSGTAKCIVPNSACTKIDSNWICRCAQGYAKKSGLCTQLPSELFLSKQSSLSLTDSSKQGHEVTKIDFTEVQGLYKTKPEAEIMGTDSDVFTVKTVNTEMVTIALNKKLTKPKYDIFVVVSVTADGIVIRDFRHIAITVNKDSVIRKEIFIMDGTLKDSVVGRVCQSCLLFENMTQIDRDNIVSVENDGIIITSKTIDLNNIQGSTTIAYSTYVEIQQQFTSVTVANITIHIIRAKFECVLPEDSVANTVVGNLNLNNPFSIDSEFQMNGMSLTLGSVVLDYIEQIEVMKSLKITINDHTFDTTIMINVQDVNDKSPIFLAKPYNFFTLESAYPGLIVGVVSATDPDTNSVLTFSIIPNDKLLINEYGIISIQSGFGVNATSYNATVTVTDGLHPVTEYVTVDIEQATTSNLQNRFVGQISENVNSQVITKVNITGYTNYEFTDRSAHLDFSIDSKTGEVKNARAFDREKETEREFKYTIVANEEGELKCSLVVIGEITITVTDQNDEPPEFNSHSYTATVMENALAKLLVVPEISTTDKDLNPTVTYSISTNTDIFAIDSSTGTIRTKSQIDREFNKSVTVGVGATDGVNSITTTVTVKILDANDNNPQFDSGQNSVSVSENSSIGAHVTTILANDADDGKNADITFDLVSNGGPFRINQTAGEITVTGKLDRESSESHRVIIYARDNGKQIRSSSMSVTITVLDANDNPPVFTIDEIEVEFEENKNCSNRISTISATDADKSGSINSQITYSLLSGNGMHHFILDPSGILKCNKTLNYEEQSSYQITVKAQDNGSPPLSSTQSVIINLRDVNDNVPIFESPPTTITIRYFSATERVIEVFKATDKDSGENGRVTYSISGTAASFLSIDPSNGILRTKSSININNNNYTLQVIARDNGNPMKQRSTSVRVTVVKKGTNQPIQFTQQEINMTVKENRQINSPLESVSSKVTNTASVTLNYEIIDSSSDLAFDVNPTSGMVTLSKPVDREKNDIHEFVVRVKNQADNKESDLALVRVRIEDENDNKPTFVRSAYFFKVYENRAITTVVDPQNIKILARDVDIGDNAIIEFQLSGEGLYKECSSAFSLENAGENAQSIKLSKKVDYEVLKKCVFSIEAYNPNNRTMSTSVYVTVDILDYNDNPPEFTEQSSNNVFTVHLLENTTINDPQNFGTVKDDDSGANGDIHLTVLNDDCWVTVTKDAEQLILQVKENANLDYESGPRLKDCIIKATDKGTPSLSSTVTLSMILVDVNDNRPVIANPNINTSVSRDADVGNTTIVNEIPATDEDSGENGKLGYKIQASEHSSKFTIDADTGKITLNSPLLTVQKDKMSIAVIVSDKGDPPLSTTAMVSIHILDENPRPYFAQSETVNVTEHAPKLNGNLGTVEAYDRSGDQIIKCDCTYLLDTKREDIIIESNTGTIKFKNRNYALDRESEPYGKVTIGVIATDKGSPPKNSKTMPFTINILDINDHSPTFKDDYSFKIPQNAPEGTTIGTVTAYDIDEDPQTLYNISISNNGGFNETVVTIGNRTGKITTSGNLTLRSGQKGEIEGKVFAVDGKDPTKSPSRVGIKIKVEFDSNNKHAPVFQNTPYETAITWNLAAGSPITKVNATDADTGRSGNVTYSIIENSKREFFTVHNKDGVISLAYQLDSSIGDTDKVKLYLTIKAQDNGIVPKSSTTTVTLQVTGQNPGVCIQGAEHSKETQELEDERATWTIAVYVLVGLLCVFIVLSFFFVYKWRTSSPVISTPAERNKQTYFDNMEYDELEKRKTVEYSQSNQAFEPPRKDIDFTEQDPYQKPYAQAGGASFKTSPYDEPIPDLKAMSNEPKPDYPVYDWETKATKVLPPVVPSSYGSSS